MTMELEGNLLLERAHTRRWVSIIAVIIPVTAVVLLAAWFVRVYIAPPTIAIPAPMIMADDPPPPAAVSKRVEIAAAQPTAMAEPADPPPASERPVAPSTLPMFATLAVVPPALTLGSTPHAYADPAQDAAPVAASITVAESAALEPAEALAGPVPLPRAKPHRPIALLNNAIPLPRPRPVESTPPPDDLRALDHHAIE